MLAPLFLAIPPLEWEHIQDAMEPHTLNAFEHLIQRLDAKAVAAMVEESKETLKPAAGAVAATGASAGAPAKAAGGGAAGASAAGGAAKAAPAHGNDEPLAPIIDINAFAAVDLRVGRRRPHSDRERRGRYAGRAGDRRSP